MRLPTGLRLTAAAALSAATLGLGLLVPATATASDAARTGAAPAAAPCFRPGAGLRTFTRGGQRLDHREVSLAEQRQIESRTSQLLQRRGAPPEGAVVPVYVHVMASKKGAGNASPKRIRRQMTVLDRTFAGSGFSFDLKDVDRFRNDRWHRDKKSVKYRTATRRGGANALNIWLVHFDYLGIATFPWDYPDKGAIDGLRVEVGSLPGGQIENYNLGKTATHEAGHWFGLYHTFQGGCTTKNDRVEDTPAQLDATSGCPEGADTCPLPGLDPIHNYMDYSYDACYENFSDGQMRRMRRQFEAWRS